jgi:mRNA interferase MazF
VFVPRSVSHLPRDSVVNVTQLFTIDREALTDRVATLPPEMRNRIDDGLRLVLSL